MRFGVVIDLDRVSVAEVPALARSVQDAGQELLWLRSGSGRHSTLAVAAACAAVDGLLVGAEVRVDTTHPVHLAEERNVADQLLGGRLVLGLTSSGDPGLDEEWVQVLLGAAGTTPFRHEGPHHTVPAGLPQNVINPERRIRVTPAPFSLEPQVWLVGVPGLAARHGLTPVLQASVAPAEAHREWESLEAVLGPLSRRLRRPAVRSWDPVAQDAAHLVDDLVVERDLWGLDTVVADLSPAPGESAWHTALADLAGVVRPRVQTETLPSGLVEFWDDVRTQRSTNEREVTR